jgi:hypothetical protein
MKDRTQALAIIICIIFLSLGAILSFYPFQGARDYLQEFEDSLPIPVLGIFGPSTNPPVQMIGTPISFDKFMELVYSPQAMHVNKGEHASYYVSIQPRDTTGIQLVYMYRINPYELLDYLDTQSA